MGHLSVSNWSIGRKAIFYALIVLCGLAYVFPNSDSLASDPMSFGDMIMMWIVVYLGCAFARRGGNRDGLEFVDHDREIEKLQRKLSDAAYSLSRAQARGDHGAAAQFSAMVREYESKLRRLGA